MKSQSSPPTQKVNMTKVNDQIPSRLSRVAIQDIKPNPNRNFRLNPLREDKLEELSNSIQNSGLWENIIVRPLNSHYELAYGHHRIEAARRANLTEVDVIVKELSDDGMRQMMSQENSDVYGSDILSVIESIEATLSDYKEGALKDSAKLKPIVEGQGARPDTWRTALAYKLRTSDKNTPCLYTATTLAKFIGQTRDKGSRPKEIFKDALAVLELIELGDLGITRDGIREWINKFYSDHRCSISKYLDEFKRTRANRLEKEKAEAERAKRDAEQARVNRDNAEAEAKRVREEGEAIKTRLAFLQAEDKAACEQEEQRRTKAIADRREQIQEKVLEQRRKLEENKLKAQQIEEKIRNARKAEKAFAKGLRGSATEIDRQAAVQEIQEQTQFAAYFQSLLDEVHRIMSSEHDLNDRLRRWTRNPRTTDNQRALLKLALRDLSTRAAEFNPDLPKG